MELLHFPSQRFTPDEVHRFHQSLLSFVEKGLWAGILRMTAKKTDSIVVICAIKQAPLYAIEKDETGNYKLFGLSHQKRLLLGLYPDIDTALDHLTNVNDKPPSNQNDKRKQNNPRRA